MSPLETWRQEKGWARTQMVCQLWKRGAFYATEQTLRRWETGETFPGRDAIVALKCIGAKRALVDMISWLS